MSYLNGQQNFVHTQLDVFLVVLSIACYIEAGTPKKIYELKITSCSCVTGSLKCWYKQLGYGYVSQSFSTNTTILQVNCRAIRLITAGGFSKEIIGFDYECPLPSRTGQFEIRSGSENICGQTYDNVTVNDCQYNLACACCGSFDI